MAPLLALGIAGDRNTSRGAFVPETGRPGETSVKPSIRLFAVLLVAAAVAPPAGAAIVTVGSGAGCQQPTLQAALNVISNQPGEHTIRLRRETFLAADGVVYTPTVAQTTVFLEGGYAECTDAAPGPGLDDISNLDASGGLQRPALRLVIAGQTGSFQIRRLAIQGGDATETANAYNGAGGGLWVRGPASVLLGRGAQVRNNHASKGGGVALVGGQITGTTPERIDFYLAEGASITNNQSDGEGGGIYCGGAAVNGPTFAARHAAIVASDGTIGFNTAGGLGGAFYCHGTVEGGGGFQPRPGNGQAVLIVGNTTTGNCAAGSGTFDAAIPFASDGFRPMGALDGSNGIVALANNASETGSAALCISASRTLGSDTRPVGLSVFRLQNLIVSGQAGIGTLGLVISDEEVHLRVQPSGRKVACEFFTPTPCVSFTDNSANGTAGVGAETRLISNAGLLDIVRASIRDNVLRGTLARVFSGRLRVDSSIIADNTVQTPSLSSVRSAFALGYNLTDSMGELRLQHATVVFTTPLDRFLDFDQADSNATLRASILAATATPAPVTVAGVGAPNRLRREWCGLFQDTSDFASHTEIVDPTSGVFTVLSPASLKLDPETYAPGEDLVDRCTRSITNDFHGNAFGSVAYFPNDPPADIGAVENRDDVIFADGFQ